jgi:hypothetical protein
MGPAGAANVPLELVAMASSQSVWVKTTEPTVAIPSAGKTPDQNDRSIVFVLKYGSFQYFLGGDIAGTGSAASGNGEFAMPAVGTKRKFTSHADVETTLRGALVERLEATPAAPSDQKGKPKLSKAGHCCVFKANHHASMSSVDVHLVSALQPRVCIITSGFKEHYHQHPTKEVLGRLQMGNWETPAGTSVANTLFPASHETWETSCGVHITEMAEKVKGKDHPANDILHTNTKLQNVKVLGTIVIRPTDESVAAAQDAATTGTGINIQVYGDGLLTMLGGSDAVLRTTPPLATAGVYPVGPFLHCCACH